MTPMAEPTPATIPESPSAKSGGANLTLLNPLLVLIDFMVTAFAAFTLAAGQSWRWIDVRPIPSMILRLWAVSVIALEWSRYARLRPLAADNAAPADDHRLSAADVSPARRALLSWLLVPTLALLPVLLWNCITYYHLYAENRIDVNPLPMSAPVLLLFVAWLVSRPDRTVSILPRRRHARCPPPGPLPAGPPASATNLRVRKWRWYMLPFAAGWLLLLVWFFFFVFTQNPPSKNQRIDLAVVFGHRVLANGKASVTLRTRAMEAVRLFREHRVRYIMVSGSIDPIGLPNGKVVDRSEADAMLNVCLHHGVPRNRIIVDPLGHNTRASVYDARCVMRRRGFKSVVGVSYDYHLPRIHLAFAQAGIWAYTIAAQPTQWRETEPWSIFRELVGFPVYYFDPRYHEPEIEKMNVRHPRLVVFKSQHKLELFDGAKLVKTYACITGKNPGDKQIEGDKKTPLGDRKIVWKNPESKYHLSMAIDYPDAADAQRGLNAGLLTRPAYDKLVALIAHGNINDTTVQDGIWKTPLGGEIFIHGCADHRAGTAGCVALSNADIEQLYGICHVGTPVEILP